MKKISFILLAGFFLSLGACNNSAEGDTAGTKGKTKADSLMDDVMDGHDVGMGKMGRLNRTENEVSRLLDSIAKLPAKAQEAAAPYKAKLDELLTDLKSADQSMNQWMQDFNMDSAIDNAEERIKYLTSEKLKVTTVKDAILSSLDKADSLLKRKL